MRAPDEPDDAAEPATENPEDHLIAGIDAARRAEKAKAAVVTRLTPRERDVLSRRLRATPLPRDPYRRN